MSEKLPSFNSSQQDVDPTITEVIAVVTQAVTLLETKGPEAARDYHDTLPDKLKSIVSNQCPSLDENSPERFIEKRRRPLSEQYRLQYDKEHPDQLVTYGKGGSSVVYRGIDRIHSRPVAIKILNPKLQSNPIAVRQFFEEADLQSQLQHPGIPTVLQSGLDADLGPFIVMEPFADDRLAEYLKRFHDDSAKSIITAPHAFDLLREITAIVAYLHSLKVTHGDIKPINIILAFFGQRFILLDYGLARRNGERITSSDRSSGTLAYAPPELCRNLRGIKYGQIDYFRADVFTLCVTGLETLTGKHLVDESGQPLPETIDERLNNLPPEFLGLTTIIRKGLQSDPDKRYADASELLRELDDFRGKEARKAQDAIVTEAKLLTAKRGFRRLGIAAFVILGVGSYGFVKKQQAEETSHKLKHTFAQLADATRQTLEALTTVVDDVQRELAALPSRKIERKRQLDALRTKVQGLVDAQIDLSTAAATQRKIHILLGDIARYLGENDLARIEYKTVLAIADEPSTLLDKDETAAKDRCLILDRLGDIAAEVEDFGEAKKCYLLARKGRLPLANTITSNNALTRDTRSTHILERIRSANRLKEAGRFRESIETYEIALNESKQFADDYPDEAVAQRRICQSYLGLGQVPQGNENLPKNYEYIREGCRLWLRLTILDPESIDNQISLSSALTALGDAAMRLDNFDAAHDAHRKAVHWAERSAITAPLRLEVKRNQSGALAGLANVLMKKKQTQQAIAALEEAIAITTKLLKALPADHNLLRDRNDLSVQLENYRRQATLGVGR
jgi:tetratricopeptide (TPR) repeat protein